MRVRALMRTGAALAVLTVTPSVVAAQDADAEGFDNQPLDTGIPTIDVDARAGVAVPLGDLQAFSEPGLSLGLGAAFWLSDHFAIRVDGDFADLQSDAAGLVSSVATPDMSLFHYGAGVEVDVPGRAYDTPWSLEVNAGAGGTTLDTDKFIDTVRDGDDLTKTYPNVNAGAEIGREVTDNVLVSLSGQVFYTFIEDNALTPLQELRATETLDDAVSLPITLSVRWDLPMTRGSSMR